MEHGYFHRDEPISGRKDFVENKFLKEKFIGFCRVICSEDFTIAVSNSIARNGRHFFFIIFTNAGLHDFMANIKKNTF